MIAPDTLSNTSPWKGLVHTIEIDGKEHVVTKEVQAEFIKLRAKIYQLETKKIAGPHIVSQQAEDEGN